MLSSLRAEKNKAILRWENRRWESGSEKVLYGIDVPTLALANGVTLVAAAIAALTGFGYALLATPILVMLLPPRIVVPVVLQTSIVLLLLLAYEARVNMDWKKIGRWVLGALPGMFLGGYALWVIEDGQMRSLIGVITLLAAALTWLRPSKPWKREWPGSLGVGLLSGIMAGASGMSGPPVVLYGLKQNWEHSVLRASLIGYFGVVHFLTLCVLQGYGMVDRQTLMLGGAILPGLIVGFALGMKWRNYVDQKVFRYIALGLLCTTGILALLKH
jgi:uncharacterized membrane protein YfcA